MAFDAFIQIDGIAGEALDEQYTNWVEITGYNFGVNQSTKEVKLALCRAGTDKLKYYEIVLEEVIIADYSQNAGSGVPIEIVQLNYGRIKTTYTRQKRSDGSGGGNVAGGWDRINNKKYA